MGEHHRTLVATLDIAYEPRITSITFPYMEQYARNIGADFVVIGPERAYDPSYPVVLEKFRLREVSEPYDWTIFLDADLLINPDCFDLTQTIDPDTVLVPEHLDPKDQFNHPDIDHWHCPLYLSVFSSETRDRVFEWHSDPLSFTPYINPKSPGHVHYENSKGDTETKPEWFLDEFLYNLNLAQHRIPTASIKESFPEFNIAAHTAAPVEQKIAYLIQQRDQLNEHQHINR